MTTSVSSDRLLQALTALSLLVTPVLVAVIGFRATDSSTSKDYVALAVSILNAKDSPMESRKWASAILNKLSPVAVPEALNQQLGSGGGLIVGPYVSSPPIDCPSKQSMSKIKAERPIRHPKKGRTMEQIGNDTALFAAEMEAYANYTEAILRMCSRTSDTWMRIKADNQSSAIPTGPQK